ncbi:hypothetical protein [Paenibacillus sp. IHBB 10380]|uniref:hypothetical protein n=1 Tax=Paenibacillus sp. IHBB 10380 TaxID=1566358 RepID=UPI000B0109A8|nr:hypothetical protein [Paenibacillus sp. IHBB 10380]
MDECPVAGYTEVLKPFAEYELWEHDEDSPITAQQIGQCVAIGTTVDGDFLALHPETAQLLWLPRHAEQLMAITLQARERKDERTYVMVLDEIYRQVYGSGQEDEPWTGSQSHLFLRLPPGQDQLSLPKLAGMCRAAFSPDLAVETGYTCHLFYRQLGGYIRFNYYDHLAQFLHSVLLPHSSEAWETDEEAQYRYYNVLITGEGSNKIKTLLFVKKTFSCDYSQAKAYVEAAHLLVYKGIDWGPQKSRQS